MGKIVVSAELAVLLRKCEQEVTLCDADGNVIGFFERHCDSMIQGDIPEFDEEELDRREARHEVMTSEEVRRGLGIPPRKTADEL